MGIGKCYLFHTQSSSHQWSSHPYTPEVIVNVLFRARLHLQWIKEQEINMFVCDSVSLCPQCCLFGSVLRERYILKHLIAS